MTRPLQDLFTIKAAAMRPLIVCLCGSTRFIQAFQEANLRETLVGNIVLSIGCDTKSDQDLGLGPVDKAALDLLHLFKIDLADEILVLNVGGYIGLSTQREISYATRLNKSIRWLENGKFWNQVQIADPDECWLWQGPKVPAGYGMFRDARLGKGKWYAHRLSYEWRHGRIPEGLFVLHSCDTPDCVNPYHLFTGTQADNIADMISKGRGFIPPSRGEKNGRAKFREADIREIRRRYAEENISLAQLGREYGTTRDHIHHIVRRQLWKNVM
jgi:HNH endonuclease